MRGAPPEEDLEGAIVARGSGIGDVEAKRVVFDRGDGDRGEISGLVFVAIPTFAGAIEIAVFCEMFVTVRDFEGDLEDAFVISAGDFLDRNAVFADADGRSLSDKRNQVGLVGLV